MAPMSEDEHNVEHILYVESDAALQAKHRADESMKDNNFAQTIAELTVCIEALAIGEESFGALRHAAAWLTNFRAFTHLRLGAYDAAYADGLRCIEIDVEGGRRPASRGAPFPENAARGMRAGFSCARALGRVWGGSRPSPFGSLVALAAGTPPRFDLF